MDAYWNVDLVLTSWKRARAYSAAHLSHLCRAPSQVGSEWQEVMRYEPGDAFGERALLCSEPRAATVVAETHLRVYKLEQARSDGLLSCRRFLAVDTEHSVFDLTCR